jgi:excinuclease ABC subunit B
VSQVFHLEAPYEPAGDQPRAIGEITQGFVQGDRHQTLLGVTGSGKTFTMANVIQNLGKKTLILTHNKTLAAQLYQEFAQFFPTNAVEFFISYYDYYQPEAYVPSSDTFIEKDASVNDEIDKLRIRATTSLLTRADTIVVASVSCIYGLGSPKEFLDAMVRLRVGDLLDRDEMLRKLVDIQYKRNDYQIERATFRVRGDVVEVQPAYEDFLYRIEFFGDEVERLSRVEVLTGKLLERLDEVMIAPAKHFVTQESDVDRILGDIRNELEQQLELFRAQGKLVEAQRLEQRVRYDMEMLAETGYCSGVENYSRVIENRPQGSRPFTLIDFFGEDWLLIVDESHVSIPQIGGMFGGDRSRKQTLVDYGFRLPCAMDNRPMSFAEFEVAAPQNILYVSATPGDYEMRQCGGAVVEQLIRPTGLLDPIVEMYPVDGQMDCLLDEAKKVIARGERVLVTTLTKKMAEDLTDYLCEMGLRVRYLHSDIDSLERTDILRALRQGVFDVLIGINLLREGLDLPEVSLVAILDADKEGFLRSHRSLIQTMGRAARNVNGRVLLFMDRWTDSLKLAVEETKRRRALQEAHNLEHGIEPRNAIRRMGEDLRIEGPSTEEEQRRPSRGAKDKQGKPSRGASSSASKDGKPRNFVEIPPVELADEMLQLAEIEARMFEAASEMRFEEAAKWRDLLMKRQTEAQA